MQKKFLPVVFDLMVPVFFRQRTVSTRICSVTVVVVHRRIACRPFVFHVCVCVCLCERESV